MTPSPTIAAVAASAATGPDPFITVVASAFGGAVLTLIGGFITHWLTGKRERARWSLELKSRVYEEAIFHMWEYNYQLYQHIEQFPSAPREFDQSDFEDARRSQALLMYAGSPLILTAYQRWTETTDAAFKLHKDFWEQVREESRKRKAKLPDEVIAIFKDGLNKMHDAAREAASTATVVMGVDVGLRGGKREQRMVRASPARPNPAAVAEAANARDLDAPATGS